MRRRVVNVERLHQRITNYDLWLAFAPSRDLSWHVGESVSIWLLFAPLVFWSPDAAGYTNDTLIGSLVIAFSVLVPMMPGRISPHGDDAAWAGSATWLDLQSLHLAKACSHHCARVCRVLLRTLSRRVSVG
jgi:hypothetical protein